MSSSGSNGGHNGNGTPPEKIPLPTEEQLKHDRSTPEEQIAYLMRLFAKRRGWSTQHTPEEMIESFSRHVQQNQISHAPHSETFHEWYNGKMPRHNNASSDRADAIIIGGLNLDSDEEKLFRSAHQQLKDAHGAGHNAHPHESSHDLPLGNGTGIVGKPPSTQIALDPVAQMQQLMQRFCTDRGWEARQMRRHFQKRNTKFKRSTLNSWLDGNLPFHSASYIVPCRDAIIERFELNDADIKQFIDTYAQLITFRLAGKSGKDVQPISERPELLALYSTPPSAKSITPANEAPKPAPENKLAIVAMEIPAPIEKPKELPAPRHVPDEVMERFAPGFIARLAASRDRKPTANTQAPEEIPLARQYPYPLWTESRIVGGNSSKFDANLLGALIGQLEIDYRGRGYGDGELKLKGISPKTFARWKNGQFDKRPITAAHIDTLKNDLDLNDTQSRVLEWVYHCVERKKGPSILPGSSAEAGAALGLNEARQAGLGDVAAPDKSAGEERAGQL